MNIIFFHNISIPPPVKMIYHRLGYSKGKTKLTQHQKDKIEKYIEDALTFIELKGAGIRIPIAKITTTEITLKEGITFKSKSLAKFLSDSKEVLLMCATAGEKIMTKIEKNSLGKDVTRAVVFDAVASETADDALNWIMDYFNRELRRENKHLTQGRFSAGYGDFPLENQKIFYEVLRMNHIGVSLTKNYMLIPEKSVTAIAGIKLF